MKSLLKNILVWILGSQVRRLRERRNFKIIGVVGSIGKTSTKIAIAEVLGENVRVLYQKGNYNDIVSVPLVFFSQEMPSLWNIFSWLKILLHNEIKIRKSYPFDFVVVELGTDAPGQINQFRKYLHLNIAVLTAVAPEHMEYFKTLEAVADEEWSINYFSDVIFANKDLCHIVPDFVDKRKIIFYGREFGSIYKIENIVKKPSGFCFDISHNGQKIISACYGAFSEVELYSVEAAITLAKALKISEQKITDSLKNLHSFSGRMQKLNGIKNSLIIDDTYNASPEAVKLAIRSLYEHEAPQRIAILGMMNELGETSEEEHKKIGRLCDPKFLDLVVTVGKDANQFLAPEARKNGCDVYEAKNAVDAGKFVKDKIKERAIILAKGSQNGVFVEEAIKQFLADPSDFSKLVRQDPVWMQKKRF